MREELVVNGVRYVLAELLDDMQAHLEEAQERLDEALAELTASEAHVSAVIQDLEEAQAKIEEQQQTVFELMSTNGAIAYVWLPVGPVLRNYGDQPYPIQTGRIIAKVQLGCGCVAELTTDVLPYPEALDVMVAEAKALQEAVC